MPLKHGKSEKAFKQNVKTEMEHGKPQKQALAIAYAIKRKAKKMAHGGLYENIHAKRERIEHGSGERMRKPGSEGAPTEEAFKQSAKTAKMAYGGNVKHCAHGGPIHCNMGCYAEGGEVEQPKEQESSEEAKPAMRERIGRALQSVGSALSGVPVPVSKPKIDEEKYKKFQKAFGKAEGGMVEDDEEIEGEGHSHKERPDYIDELENEPMGNSFHSDEFLADPYGEMTSNHHVEFDPDVEEEEHGEGESSSFHDMMEYNPEKRLEKIMAKRRVKSVIKK